MDGKDLFLALGQVQDEFITEAETYAGRRVISMHSVRWIGALAACICLLIGWAVAAQWTDNPLQTLFNTGSSNEAAMDEAATEAAEEAATTEGGYTKDIAEAEEETADAGCGKVTDGAAAKIIDHYTGEETAIYCYGTAENGEWFMDHYLEEMLQAHTGEDAYFLVAVELSRDGKVIDADSEEYAAEIERLTGLGYTFRTLSVQHRDKSLQVQVCGLFTEEQLTGFDASGDYGYFFYFPENKDGTPLDWEDAVNLPGKTQQD